jgi:cell division initiation protein
MITPLDIQNKEFPKSVRGYKEEEVDGFLDLLTLDFEKLIEDNQRLKEQVKSLGTELSRYQKTESMVLETLEAAKALMGDISASAERRAEILLKNAELDAERITREAKESVERINEETLGLKNRLNVFRTRYRTLLEAELEKFDTLSAELFADKDMEDIKRMLEHSATGTDATSFADKTLVNLRGDNEE